MRKRRLHVQIHFQDGWLFRRKKKDGNSWKETQVFIQVGEMLLAWVQIKEKNYREREITEKVMAILEKE